MRGSGLINRAYFMYVAALQFYTGARMTDDIDAVFDCKILVPADTTVIYRDAQGKARSVYFDMNYNES